MRIKYPDRFGVRYASTQMVVVIEEAANLIRHGYEDDAALLLEWFAETYREPRNHRGLRGFGIHKRNVDNVARPGGDKLKKGGKERGEVPNA